MSSKRKFWLQHIEARRTTDLSLIVSEVLELDPFSENLFVFCNPYVLAKLPQLPKGARVEHLLPMSLTSDNFKIADWWQWGEMGFTNRLQQKKDKYLFTNHHMKPRI